MIRRLVLLLLQFAAFLVTKATALAPHIQKPPVMRRDELIRSVLSSVATASILQSSSTALAEGGLKVFQTPSGLKYIDLVPGNPASDTPQYGQLLSIAYKSYITLPGGNPQMYDSVDSYLLKHGNGRSIAGLDEGLHTMHVGGTRRLLIPPKLGYVESGLGPIPVYPWARWKLNNLLDDMVRVQGGTVVMEVTLLNAMDDEADQGYYGDDSLTPEQFETLKTNIQRKAAAAAAESGAAAPGALEIGPVV